MKAKHQTQLWIRDASLDREPKILSSSVEEIFQRIMGADQQRLQISDIHFDKFPTPATFACWKIRFKTEVCTCSQFLTEAMLWIKEVEMVESVKSTSPTTENGYENCVLTARISTRAMRTSMTQTTSTTSSRTPTRASCTTSEHGT